MKGQFSFKKQMTQCHVDHWCECVCAVNVCLCVYDVGRWGVYVCKVYV